MCAIMLDKYHFFINRCLSTSIMLDECDYYRYISLFLIMGYLPIRRCLSHIKFPDVDKFNVILELTNYFIKLIKKYKVNNKSKGEIFYLIVKLPNIQFACI